MSKRNRKKREHRRRHANRINPTSNAAIETRRRGLRVNFDKIVTIAEQMKTDTGRYPFAVLVDNANVIAADSAAAVIQAVGEVGLSGALQRELLQLDYDPQEDFHILVLGAGGVMRTSYSSAQCRLMAESKYWEEIAAGKVTLSTYNAADLMQQDGGQQ